MYRNHFNHSDILVPFEHALKKVQQHKHLQPPKANECPHCADSGNVVLTRNDAKYGREYGDWSWCYFCTECKAYVGCHEFTHIPLGTLATQPTLDARKAAHAAFDPIWKERDISRRQAYSWLAIELGIDREDCHISWFDKETCEQVVKLARNYDEIEAEKAQRAKTGVTLGSLFGQLFQKS